MTAYSPVSKGEAGNDGILLNINRGGNSRLHHSPSPARSSHPPRRLHQRRDPSSISSINLRLNNNNNDDDSDNSEANTHLLSPNSLPSKDPQLLNGTTDSEASPSASPSRPSPRRSHKVDFSFKDVGEGGRRGRWNRKHDVENQRGLLQKEVRRNLDSILGGGSSNSRYTQPRLSLLGKPLNFKAHRRDIRVRRMQARIYNFLERPKLWRSWSYHFSVMVCHHIGKPSALHQINQALHRTVIPDGCLKAYT